MLIAAFAVVTLPRWDEPRRTPFYFQVGLCVFLVGFGVYALSSDAHPFYWLVMLVPFVATLELPGKPVQASVGSYMLAFLAATALTHVVFFGEDRYHLVLTPILCVLAAAALRPQGTVSGPSLSASER